MLFLWALLLAPLILLTTVFWVPFQLLEQRYKCNDVTQVNVTQLRRVDALSCSLSVDGTVNGAPWSNTFLPMPCDSFGTCVGCLLSKDTGSCQQQECTQVVIGHNHWDVERCMGLSSVAARDGYSYFSDWAEDQAGWWWMWQEAGIGLLLLVLLWAVANAWVFEVKHHWCSAAAVRVQKFLHRALGRVGPGQGATDAKAVEFSRV